MKDPSHDHKEPLRSLPGGQDQRCMQTLELDPDDYREDLEEFDLSNDQQDDLLAVLWNIMRTFVEIGFGLDSVQVFSTTEGESPIEEASPDSGNRLEKVGIPRRFNQAAIEHAANKEDSSCAKE